MSSALLRSQGKSLSRLSSRRSTVCASYDAKALFSSFLTTISCYDLVVGQSVLVTPSTSTVQSAFKDLMKHRVECSPIQHSNRVDTYIGLFTFKSLALYLLHNFSHKPRRKSTKQINLSDFDLRHLVCPFIAPDKPVLDYISPEPFYSSRQIEKLSSLMHHFGRGYEYAFIRNSRNDLLGYISQVSLLSYFTQRHIPDLDRAFPEPVCQYFPNCCRRTLQTISDQELVIDALQMLCDRKMKCLTVLTQEGKMLSSLTLNDFKEVLRTKQQKMLSAALHDFVVYLSTRGSEQISIPIVYKNSKASLAIRKVLMSAQKAVWVVDSKHQPLGIIYVSDLITHLTS